MANATALSAQSRWAALDEMASATLDVLVVGGGITGAGVALDAAARGYRAGLIERDDFASGTSSRSTKLVHGGIRYLPQLDIPLVREALIERGRLLRSAPYLVQPLAFILPLYASSRHPVGLPVAPPGGVGLDVILDTGLFMYDELAGRRNIGRHRRLDREEVLERAACLTPAGLKMGFLYYDAQTDDTRLTLAVLRSAAERGALLANYCEAVRFEHEAGRVAGVWARETLPARGEHEGLRLLRARHVVNATGVWAEQTERLAGDEAKLSIAPSKGTHLVFAKETFKLGSEAVVLPETEDGRIIFIVPWQSRALVGTTDDGVERIETPVATQDEIDYLLGHLNRFASCLVGRDDIVATFAGYRPLLKLRRGRTPARLSRSHALVEGEDGLLTISGGKLTTYRKMAQDVLDRIDRREVRPNGHPTLHVSLAGASGWDETVPELKRRGAAVGLTPDIVAHLGGAYGSDALEVLAAIESNRELGVRLVADLPYVRAEVSWVCRNELALTLQDVLARRTHLALEDRSRGLDCARAVAELMACALGWDTREQTRQLASYARYALEEAGPLAGTIEAQARELVDESLPRAQ
jgi:glycerol-3-phosphate dehydrogenase